jgi:hypothetical protein
MKPIIFEFWTQGRSGNHAIINWIVQNLVEDFHSRKAIFSSVGDNDSYGTSDLIFINNYRGYTPMFGTVGTSTYLDTALKKNPKYILISYENKPIGYTIGVQSDYKFTITRSLENLVASRRKYNKSNVPLSLHMKVDNNFFNNWTTYIQHTPNIHYDKWLQDRSYRDSICTLLGVHNKDLTSYVDKVGGGSSFVGHKLDTPENLTTRHTQIQLPKDIQEQVEQLCKQFPEYCAVVK